MLRPAPKRALRLGVAVWTALARANPEAADLDEAQAMLGPIDGPASGDPPPPGGEV